MNNPFDDLIPKQQTKPNISQAESGLQGAFDTLTLGFMPKVSGAIGAGLARLVAPELFENQSFGDTYGQARDLLRQRQAQAAEANPGTYLAGGLAGGVLNPIGRGVNTVKGAAALGAGTGAAYGLGTSDTGEIGSIDANNLLDAAKSGLVGGALGGTIQSVLNPVARMFTKGSSELPETAQKALELSKQFNVPITQGQASQNLSQQALEDILASGARGDEAANIINTARNESSKAFQNAAENLRAQIGKGTFTEKGQSLQGLVDKITQGAQEGDKAIKAAYDIAKKSVGYLNLDDVQGFNKVANARLVDEALSPENAPAAYAQLNAFNKIFSNIPENAKGVDFKRIEAYRQGLNRAFSAADGQDKFGIGLLKDQFDNYLDDTIENALVKGDKNILDKFKNARGIAAQIKQNYTAKDASEFGKKFVQDLVENSKNSREPYTYSMISDKIFGANKYGFKPQAVSIVKEIKNQVGADSPEFDGLKLDAVQKIVKPLLNNKGEINLNAPAVQTFKNNLKDNEPVLREMLAPNEIKQLYDLGDLGSVMFQSKKSVVNPPQSGLVANLTELPFVQRVLNLPYIREIPAAINSSQARSAVNQASLEKNLRNIVKETPSTQIAPSVSLSAQSLVDKLNRASIAPEANNEQNPDSNMIPIDDNPFLDLLPNNPAIIQQQQPQIEQMPPAPIPQSVVTPELLNKISTIESNNNPLAKAKTSSASGLYQFTDPTWKEAVKRYGEQTGIALKDKNNPMAQKVMAELMLKDNAEDLQSFLGRDPKPTEVYLTHFLGLNGAKKLLQSHPEQYAARVFPEAAKVNRSMFFRNGKPITVAELYKSLDKKVQSA